VITKYHVLAQRQCPPADQAEVGDVLFILQAPNRAAVLTWVGFKRDPADVLFF
jgi:hypothetical protein